jgi:hypothetical protein
VATTSSLPTASAIGPYGAVGVFLGEPVEDLVKTSKVDGTPIIATQKSGDGCIAYTMLVPADLTRQPAPPAKSTDDTTPDTTLAPTIASTPASTPSTLPADPGPPGALATKPGVLSIVVAPKAGVVQIGGIIALHTPEGVALGTDSGQLFRIYPGLVADDVTGRLITTAPGGKGAHYVFAIGRDHDVAELWLRGPATSSCRF